MSIQPLSRGGGGFMGKVPFSNPNPKSSKKRQLQKFQGRSAVLDIDEPPRLARSAASNDASSVNRRPANNGFTQFSGYASFNVATYTKKELVALKNRLVLELEKIRQLKNRIEVGDFRIRSNQKQRKQPTTSTNGKKLSGNKRPFPTNFSAKDNTHRSNPEYAELMKQCGQILNKLMKHKHGRVFNSLVDVEGLQLHDYYDIIKHPMDLGTVKMKLGKNLYDSPRDFAADVRLTFNNAMKYNPKGHEVHVLAEQFLSRFEDLYRPVKERVGKEEDREELQEVLASSGDHNRGGGEARRADKIKAKDEVELRSESAGKAMHQTGVDQNMNGNVNARPVRTPSPVRAPPVKAVKQPKPKAKDPNKREMSLEEKHKLGVGLQSLPQEKMEQVVQIIRKRNGHLRQDGDELELDIEAVDTETLWELDRFVTNYKKLASKIKRQALMGVNNAATVAANEGENKDQSGSDSMDVVAETKKPKKGDPGEEDVDIDDDMPVASFPPVEIEKDNGHVSGSSSSSSDDSSSSSDSDSGSSSGSDAENAHS